MLLSCERVKEAYPEDDVCSAVLLLTFLSGLHPSVTCQVMLKGRRPQLPKKLYVLVALIVHAVHLKDNEVEQLGYMTEQKFESIEQQLKELNAGKTTNSHDSVKRVRRNVSIGAVSWKRSEVGERILMNVSFAGKMVIGRGECPLNFSESALTVDWGWHIRKKQSFKPHNKVGKVPLHVYVYNNSLLRVKGQLEGRVVECLVGFLLSVIPALLDSVKDSIRRSNVQVIGANGSPLDVRGMLNPLEYAWAAFRMNMNSLL